MMIVGNTLHMTNLNKDMEGMYQCSAQNTHGVAFTAAQLRILSKDCIFDFSIRLDRLDQIVLTQIWFYTVCHSIAIFTLLTRWSDGLIIGMNFSFVDFINV